MGKQKNGNKAAGTANKTKDSLTKVVVKGGDVGEWVRPNTLEKFYIDEDAIFPSIVFEIKTEQPGPYKWTWTITWDAHVSGLREHARGKTVATFPTKTDKIATKGKFSQDGKSWDSKAIGHVVGGKLSVTVEAGWQKFKRTVQVLGKSPGKEKIDAYIKQKVNGGSNSSVRDNGQDRATAIATMGKILQQESNYKHFLDLDSEPIVAFDKGYGLSQLTSDNPTYEQVWNWKAHVDEALRRMVAFRAASVVHFNKHSAWHQDDAMLETNSISLWNGGHYYVPDVATKKWVRNPQMLCVPNQGNVGFKLPNNEIGKKTVKELQAEKRKPAYTGVCYADTILD
jgi:hypothetical protein